MLVKDLGGHPVFIKTKWTAGQNLEADLITPPSIFRPHSPWETFKWRSFV